VANRTNSPGDVLPDPGHPDRSEDLYLLAPVQPGYPLDWQATVPLTLPRLREQSGPIRLAGLGRQLADPLARNGYALIANSGATGALGLVYWLLMARLYPTAAVGMASAAYAAMNLLAGFTALNFNGVLTRFIPQAGRMTRTFVTRAYVVSALASVCISFLFLRTISHWDRSYSELDSIAAGLIFVGCVVAWAMFTLQDSVLIGLRGAVWVFGENSMFGVAKIILLVLLVTALPHHLGIYVSWMLPVFVAVPLVNALIFGRLVPRHTLLTYDLSPPSSRQIGRFLAGDYSGALCVLATGNLVPVLVAARISIQSVAYFYMAWVIAGIVNMIGVNMAMSLTVEGSFEAATLAANCRKALRKMTQILLPSAGAVALLAPWGLRLFGPAYAANGAPVLELLALAALPSAVIELYLGALRAKSRTTLVALIQAVRGVLMLGLTLVLTGAVGTIGAGVAVVSSQGVVAVLISFGLWRVLAGDRRQLRPAFHDKQHLVSALSGLVPMQATAPASDSAEPPISPRAVRLADWPSAAVVGTMAAGGAALFFASLHRVALSRMNGLGLLAALPPGVIAGVALLALAFMLGLAQSRPRPIILGAALTMLVVCLDGITAFVEPEARFPTAYQIAGFVNYVSTTGHAAPGLAAYFSWPGFFALVAFVTGAAGTHSLLTLLRVWPMAIDLLYLPPFFLLTRNLRISWRARWLAGFLFTVGNWVGQDYFSPQAFNFLLYLVFVAILVNWFTELDRSQPSDISPKPRLARLRRRLFGTTPGELPPRSVSTGQQVFLLALLIAIFTVSTVSHQLTPIFMLAACAALVLVRRCRLKGLPVLLGVILVAWVSFAAVGYWSGHISNIFGAIGDLGANVSESVGGRLTGSSATHLLALHARIALAGIIVGLAALGLLRRRKQGIDDRVLLTLLCVPVLMAGLQGYGGEIALRIYLFMLPASALLGACLLFPRPEPGRASWRPIALMAGCALVLPVIFFLARYGNEAYEQTPVGELTAANWIYAHDAHGVRLMWLSQAPSVDDTPEMPWAYEDLSKVDYIPVLAPRDPARVGALLSALRSGGPGTYLVADQTDIAALQFGASYAPSWDGQFRRLMTAAPGVRVVFADSSSVIYTLHWPPGARSRPLPVSTGGGGSKYGIRWAESGPIVLWLLLAVLAGREFIRVCRPAARLIHPLNLISWPLLALMLEVIVLRFIALS
jgi:O-antigen/teichoic acid export membrane protein